MARKSKKQSILLRQLENIKRFLRIMLSWVGPALAIFFFYLTNVPKLSTSIFQPMNFNNPGTQCLIINNNNFYSIRIDSVISNLNNVITENLSMSKPPAKQNISIKEKISFDSFTIKSYHSMHYLVPTIDSLKKYLTMKPDQLIYANISISVFYKSPIFYWNHSKAIFIFELFHYHNNSTLLPTSK